MPDRKLPESINLLEPINEPIDIWTKAYTWVTGAGRVLLVFVEVIVLGVFMARFILDEQNNDLTDEIQGQIDTLSQPLYRKDEARFRSYHAYLTDIRTLEENQKINSDKFGEVLDNLPEKYSLKALSLNNNVVTLSLSTTNFKDIATYTSYLNRNYDDVSVSLTKSGGDTVVEEVALEDLDNPDTYSESKEIIHFSISFKFRE